MKGSEGFLTNFLSGQGNHFIIPVYQRNYDWSTKQCKQLFDDLMLINKNRKKHFFGSIVYAQDANGHRNDYVIIDGQQRITTISILYLAMLNLLKNKLATSKEDQLTEKIEEYFIINKYEKDDRKLRLKPVKNDGESFKKLVSNDEDDFVKNSNITNNYYYFYKRILEDRISIDDLCYAIGQLEIVEIYLNDGDNPQLIFESLNSTGLDLTEADKIRNFILMGLDSKTQENYYTQYWNKIEDLSSYHVDNFIRHYLTIKLKRTPKIDTVYVEFKNYIQDKTSSNKKSFYKSILEDMLLFAKIYNIITSCVYHRSKEISDILKRLKQMDMSVTHPFLLMLFYRLQKSEISENELLKSILCLESYIFRRIICASPTNSLNKIFATLDVDVMNKKRTYSYEDTLIYILEHKSGNSGFPNDEKFKEGLKNRDIYHMTPKNKQYIFDRLENRDTVERVNVIELMEERKLTIEHIMPQTLSPEWKEELGENWEQIFNTRLNTLPNLTLTGYNSKYSNNLFREKKTCEKGFKESGLYLNKPLLDFEKWTEVEMDKRWEELSKLSLELWTYPKTNFVPEQQQADEITLEEVDYLRNRKLISFTYGNAVDLKANWVQMFTNVVKQLYVENPAPMYRCASESNFLKIQLSSTEKKDYQEISSNLYLWIHNDTNTKIRILSQLFDEYDLDKSELIFKLEPESNEKQTMQ